jgi:hypothetical protein
LNAVCRADLPGVHESPQESTRVWTGSMPMASAFSARSPRIQLGLQRIYIRPKNKSAV